MPEVLASILSHLDMRTLLLAQRVSSLWHTVIAQTPTLQRALFFDSITASSEHELTVGRKRNPLLAAHLPLFFADDDNYERRNAFTDPQKLITSQRRPQRGRDIPHDPTLDAFLRHIASWRRMLVQQPAAMIIGYIENRGPTEQQFYNGVATEPQGVRIGPLYDLVYSSIGHASHKSRCRVYWRGPAKDPPLTERSYRYDGDEAVLWDFAGDVAVAVARDARGQEYLARAARREEVVGEYMPEGWASRSIKLKFIAAQCWFG
ncbi:hypothetical protein F5Y15DRAFT_426893 [Xylariaceae sp. FL0016]|nr:hypothetical protein F5Y15DRAFT_426893 [Xylariaceae sp. FL0016]